VRLLLATTNAGKRREMQQLLSGMNIELDDLSTHSEIPAPEETGQTFEANAALKAAYYAKILKVWTLADDSGLAVGALNGKPGVHSARWAQINGDGAGDAANNALLLKQLDAVQDEKRTARFVCALALADPQGHISLTVTDHVEGRILREARGSNGFGYDPLFYVESRHCTTAQMSPEQKNSISHRGKAMRRMAELLGKHLVISH
jgi:non-canonical purine NTP pyrophosphatase (RdgB/HAM1 family)